MNPLVAATIKMLIIAVYYEKKRFWGCFEEELTFIPQEE